jgi:hypothetical protein
MTVVVAVGMKEAFEVLGEMKFIVEGIPSWRAPPRLSRSHRIWACPAGLSAIGHYLKYKN